MVSYTNLEIINKLKVNLSYNTGMLESKVRP